MLLRVASLLLIASIAAGARAQPAAVDLPRPLAAAGDAARGRAIAQSRDNGGCVLCHAVPGAAFAGNLGPPLAGVGARFLPAELRLRIVDSSRIDPATIMPPYHRVSGLAQVAPAYAGKPILDAQQVEDLVAYLATLQ
jgi:sulfur-oxidizing protein SoxX